MMTQQVCQEGEAMKKKRSFIGCCILCILIGCFVTACGSSQESFSLENRDPSSVSRSLNYRSSMELDYAQEFSVDYYQDGYSLISISDGTQYLLIPEGKKAPEDLGEDIIPLCQPVENIYLAASAVMDMFVSVDALDTIRFSSLQKDSWYIEPAKQAMETGSILYAGKYSAPDYEQILNGECGLAIENTMIFHTPEVKEQLAKFGIPVFVDYSSYEEHPLGRTEWVKLYGLLTGREEEAQAAFASEKKAFESVSGSEQTGKTVAFFYVTASGQVNVRRATDYLPKMIEMAGGKYIFQDTGDDGTSSTMSMEMEEFYAQARDADYIIYNSTIDGELSSVEDLIAKNPLFSNFRAVQDKNVYCTSKNLYQSTMELGSIIADIHNMLNGGNDNLTYIYKLE